MLTAPADYVFERQTAWARRRGLRLVGSAGTRGRAAYTETLAENLFEPLSADARAEFTAGDGGELGRTDGIPGKMQAVHSSSALSCNLFHYWRRVDRLNTVAEACRLPPKNIAGLGFEQHLPIDVRFRYTPNLDAVFRYSTGPVKVVAVECKFCEAFSTRPHLGVKDKYLDGGIDDLWKSMPRLRKVAKELSPNNERYRHLDAAQLLKHLLGLKRLSPSGSQLLYLYYDVPGPAGSTHMKEVQDFSELAKQDSVAVTSATYQDVLMRLARDHRREHASYIDYMIERYL